ncbi:uncharacterized protein V6R79_020383 [Siganus canaliculatus]
MKTRNRFPSAASVWRKAPFEKHPRICPPLLRLAIFKEALCVRTEKADVPRAPTADPINEALEQDRTVQVLPSPAERLQILRCRVIRDVNRVVKKQTEEQKPEVRNPDRAHPRNVHSGARPGRQDDRQLRTLKPGVSPATSLVTVNKRQLRPRRRTLFWKSRS